MDNEKRATGTSRRAVLTAGAAASVWSVPVIRAAADSPAHSASQDLPPNVTFQWTNLALVRKIYSWDSYVGAEFAIEASPSAIQVLAATVSVSLVLKQGNTQLASTTVVGALGAGGFSDDVRFDVQSVLYATYTVDATATVSITQYRDAEGNIVTGGPWTVTLPMKSASKFWSILQ